MNAISLRVILSITLLAATLMACSSSGDGENLGEGSAALKCRTCGDVGDPPDPHQLPPRDPPVQGPSVDCTGMHRVIDGLCYEVAIPDGCNPQPPGVICGGYTVVGRTYCPVAYPVQHCNAYGNCTCWTY
jgi:hypothetical protein